ncbi:Afadin [Amphibalanus amphitrite]|uniref:Afadin n=1 Tax=Amphibalanus amphitrite TaxID=1232801 RepID=A0A6A4X000_AMPAM|nr:Afadin [Amphibalanus amphitrite]
MDHSRTQEWEKLRATIAQWNDNRLDLFELSEPDQKLNFHGVMRFYYQDSGQKVSTKCIRVSSDATSQDVIATLIEKFRPDMRMLSTPRFALYEIHESGAEERELAPDERPLHVQLNWHQDDREGRFLLRNLNEKRWSLRAPGESTLDEGNFKRKLSKREKKDLKKKGKLHKIKSINDHDSSVAEKLYTELPETSFTRSISNPEAVMRRRRQQKLEKKLQQFRSRDGGPDTGGTLKIYGESLCSDVPYKTLLLSVTDTAAAVVQEMLQKYGRYREDPNNYCLVQVSDSQLNRWYRRGAQVWCGIKSVSRYRSIDFQKRFHHFGIVFGTTFDADLLTLRHVI